MHLPGPASSDNAKDALLVAVAITLAGNFQMINDH